MRSGAGRAGRQRRARGSHRSRYHQKTRKASERAAIYLSVLRRYLTSGENSFPGFDFPVVYVLDVADSAQTDTFGSTATARREPITAADQRAIVTGLADVATVQFVADRDSVIETKDQCAQVRGGGILIILAPPAGDGTINRLEVGIHGFVACLGATWMTYVVERTGGAWTVTGTTGPMAVA